MPTFTDTATDILALMLTAAAIANVADNAASSPLASVYGRLHTASPGAGGNQSTNEIGYTNYAAATTARTTGATGWTVSAGVATNNGTIQWPTCGVTGATATHLSLGKAASGSGRGWWYGSLTVSLPIAQNIRPQADAGAITVAIT